MILYLKTLLKVTLTIFPKFRLSMNEFQTATYGARCKHDFSAVLTFTTFTENNIRYHRMNGQSPCNVIGFKNEYLFLLKACFIDLLENYLVFYLTFNGYFFTIH